MTQLTAQQLKELANRVVVAQGVLHFAAEEHGVSRRIAVQIYGSEARVRIWAQCKREDVRQILTYLWDYNEAS